jgi:REP element-mobilizing transposase RayT
MDIRSTDATRQAAALNTDANYRLYKQLPAAWCGKEGVVLWVYCLMPNHVRLIVTSRYAANGACRGRAVKRIVATRARSAAGVQRQLELSQNQPASVTQA